MARYPLTTYYHGTIVDYNILGAANYHNPPEQDYLLSHVNSQYYAPSIPRSFLTALIHHYPNWLFNALCYIDYHPLLSAELQRQPPILFFLFSLFFFFFLTVLLSGTCFPYLRASTSVGTQH